LAKVGENNKKQRVSVNNLPDDDRGESKYDIKYYIKLYMNCGDGTNNKFFTHNMMLKYNIPKT
jgi:hypothetical protein